MSANLASLLILVFAFIAATVMVLGNAWIRSRNKAVAASDADRVRALSDENDALRAQLARQEQRLAVLERIATDPAERTAREIELLR